MAVTFTYTNDLAGSPIDRIRFEIGDTNVALGVAILNDEQIQHRLNTAGSEALAAWHSAEDIVAAISRDTDWGSGSQNKAQSQRLENYRKLAEDLRVKAHGRNVSFFVGGTTKAQKEAEAADTSLVVPFFKTDLHRNPREGSRSRR